MIPLEFNFHRQKLPNLPGLCNRSNNPDSFTEKTLFFFLSVYFEKSSHPRTKSTKKVQNKNTKKYKITKPQKTLRTFVIFYFITCTFNSIGQYLSKLSTWAYTHKQYGR